MPRRDSSSPARPPLLDQRASSSQSMTKGSPNAGHLSKSHKGSSAKLHKSHAVGHGRHPHGRVPSYGKGLHKLSKLGPGEAGESGHIKHHNRSASHSPTGSPITNHIKKNSSQISLPRVGSKVSVKKNASAVSLKRNASGTKLGNHPKSEKSQTKNDLRKGTADFSIGDEEEEDWEEASSSQSPYTTRTSSVGRKTPQLEDPPSPDEPPQRSPTNLPHSPPQSPPIRPSAFVAREDPYVQNGPYKLQKPSKFSHPLDGDEVSHRLLDRSKHNAEAKVSNISATITPSASTGSPIFREPHRDSSNPEASMPADGISRFLDTSSGSSGHHYINHLQSTLAAFDNKAYPPRQTHSPSPSQAQEKETRRVKSAANLTHPRLDSDSSSLSPPKPSPPESSTNPNPKPPRISPYESARGADPNAGKSLTQLKLDLQRMSTLQDTPSSQSSTHPLMYNPNASVISITNLHADSSEMHARLARQYHLSHSEFRNTRRFYGGDILVRGRLRSHVKQTIRSRRAGKGKGIASRGGSSTHTPTGSVSERTASISERTGSISERTGSISSRGRGRFEVGRSPGDSHGEGDGGSEAGSVDSGDGGGGASVVQGLLRRMWTHLDVGKEAMVED